jgi:type III restriction enzyme
MNRDVKAIAGRLNLRSPPRKDADVATALEVIRSDFPLVTGFEREFPSLCFALAPNLIIYPESAAVLRL